MVDLVRAADGAARAAANRLTGLLPVPRRAHAVVLVDPAEKLYHCFGCQASGDAFRFVEETEGLDFARRARAARRPLRRRARARGRGPAGRERRRAPRAPARAAGAHRDLLRALPVGVGRGGEGARLPGRARPGGGDAARVPRRLRAERLGHACSSPSRRGRLLRPRAATRRAWPSAKRRGGGLRPLPRAHHVPARRRARAGARLRRARAARRPARRSTSTPPRASCSTRVASCSGSTARAAAAQDRAGRGRRGLHRRARPAQGRGRESVAIMGTALTERPDRRAGAGRPGRPARAGRRRSGQGGVARTRMAVEMPKGKRRRHPTGIPVCRRIRNDPVLGFVNADLKTDTPAGRDRALEEARSLIAATPIQARDARATS